MDTPVTFALYLDTLRREKMCRTRCESSSQRFQTGMRYDQGSDVESTANKMSFHYDKGLLHTDGVALSKVAAQAGTPCYIYSRDRVLQNWSAIRSASPQAEIHYSLKANANLALVKLLIAAGAGLDA